MSEQSLPKGKTCKDCTGFKMCVSFFRNLESNTTCKWIPNEFKINKKRKIGSNKLTNDKKIKR